MLRPGILGTPATGFELSLDFDDPVGTVEIRDLDENGTLLATTSLFFDSSGNGEYELDASYLSASGLVDIESLFPGLNLVGQPGGDQFPEDPWISTHREVNGKIIWSFEDGPVIVLDPNAGEAEVETPTFVGVAAAPIPLLEPPTSIEIANLTRGAIVAGSTSIPEPSSIALVALLTAVVFARLRWRLRET